MSINPSENIYPVLYKAMDSIQGHIKAVIKPYGLNCNEYEILKFIYQNGDQPIQKIGDEIKVTSGSMTYLIDKLEKNGYLTRKPCAKDRRIMYGSLSSVGEELMKQVIPACNLKINEVLAPISQDEINQTIEVLEKIQNKPELSSY